MLTLAWTTRKLSTLFLKDIPTIRYRLLSAKQTTQKVLIPALRLRRLILNFAKDARTVFHLQSNLVRRLLRQRKKALSLRKKKQQTNLRNTRSQSIHTPSSEARLEGYTYAVKILRQTKTKTHLFTHMTST